MCTMLYNLSEKGCTTPHEIFINKVVRSFKKYCTINCTTKHKLLYNLGQYVQYCTKPCTISLSNPFFSCTTFQVVYGVQPFVQYCTTYVQRCTKLYRLYRLYNLLYNIVTVWFADVYDQKNSQKPSWTNWTFNWSTSFEVVAQRSSCWLRNFLNIPKPSKLICRELVLKLKQGETLQF